MTIDLSAELAPSSPAARWRPCSVRSSGWSARSTTTRPGCGPTCSSSVGSAGFTILSITAFGAGDPGRVAAQIVTGVGFLGAGAILKEGATIRGLTTAASLWAVAAVGMAAGAGAWGVAIATTVIVIALAVAAAPPDRAVRRPRRRSGPLPPGAWTVPPASRGSSTSSRATTGRSPTSRPRRRPTGGMGADLEVRVPDVRDRDPPDVRRRELDGIRMRGVARPRRLTRIRRRRRRRLPR